MGLEFRHTCGEIDEAINDFNSDLKNYLEDLILEVSPFVRGVELDKLVRDWASTISENLSNPLFENVRGLNEEMREHADNQIGDLENEIENLEIEIHDQKVNIEELEYDLNIYETRCTELEEENRVLADG